MTIKTIPVTVINENDDFTTYHLPLLEQVAEGGRKKLLPFRLGIGRNAVVLLAWTKGNQKESKFLAFKCLKDDENEEYAQMVKERFLIELLETKRASFDTDFFVRFKGYGILGDFDMQNTDNSKWRILFPNKVENNSELPIDVQNYFDLQGPFYILELCQGSLHDLLERGDPWLQASKSYQHVEYFREAFKIQYECTREQVQEFKARYIEEEAHAKRLSGYDILNAFRNNDEAGKVRNFAVLQLFFEAAITIQNLHNLGLVHRDLKLADILLWHATNPMGFDRIQLKLADLGYAGSIVPLQKGTWTLEVDNWRTSGALAPGSQYFRAPEQANLSIEVRVDISKDDPTKVIIKNSKVTEIEKGDQLIAGDYFNESKGDLYKNVQRITNVRKEDNTYHLKLEGAIDLPSKEDLQAHIIKSTGYHTDGFSLGAALYRLASGGKNPQDFYTYKLARFYKTSQGDNYSVRDIVDRISQTEWLEESLEDSETKYDREREEVGDEVVKHQKGLNPAPKSIFEKVKSFYHKIFSRNIQESNESIRHKTLTLRTPTTTTTDSYELDYVNHKPKLGKLPRDKMNELKNTLIEDRRGMPIPEKILEIVVKCMVRNVAGAYYHSSLQTGFFADENRDAVAQLVRDVGEALNELERGTDIPYELKDNLLIKLRMFWQEPESNATWPQPSKASENEEPT